MLLGWLTFIGAGLGILERSHFAHLGSRRVALAGSAARIFRFNMLLAAGFGLMLAWHGWQLAKLNATLTTPALEISMGWLYAALVAGGVLIAICAVIAILRPADPAAERTCRGMILGTIFVVFVVLVLLSLPIVFALGLAAVAGLLVAGLPLQIIASSVVSGTQSWVLLAIPSFIFAGLLMERCGMSQALVGLARAMVGWLPGGLGMTVVACAYLFSDLCGSIMAEVSSLCSLLMKPLERAGYRSEDAASLIAAGAAMGMLVPPAIFMLVISVVTNTSAVALFLAGFIPAAVMAVCLCVLIFFRARKYGWPRDVDTSFPEILRRAARRVRSAAGAGAAARRALFRRVHHHRNGRGGRALRHRGGAALLSERLLERDGADRLRGRDAHRRGHLPHRSRDQPTST